MNQGRRPPSPQGRSELGKQETKTHQNCSTAENGRRVIREFNRHDEDGEKPMWARNRETKPCPVCLREAGQEPSGGKLCPEHQAKHNRFVSTSTSWTASLLSLFTEPETCVMYEEMKERASRQLRYPRRLRTAAR